MGGPGSGVSRKPKRLRREYRRGFLARMNHQSADYRALAELVKRLQTDQALQADEMPVTLQALTERAAFVLAKITTMETDALEGRAFDWAKYESAVKLLTRLADRLGYRRHAAAAMTLDDYAAQLDAS